MVIIQSPTKLQKPYGFRGTIYTYIITSSKNKIEGATTVARDSPFRESTFYYTMCFLCESFCTLLRSTAGISLIVSGKLSMIFACCSQTFFPSTIVVAFRLQQGRVQVFVSRFISQRLMLPFSLKLVVFHANVVFSRQFFLCVFAQNVF